MKLKSFGCSFVFGTDLPNDEDGPMATPSDHAYPVLLANQLDMPWACHARPGAGNFEILNRILTEISKGEPMLAVINWTWIDRYSWIDETQYRPNHPYNPLGWRSILPVETDARAEFYYRNLHTQLRDKIETLICIKSAIDCLRSAAVPFIMTWTDYLIWETKWHCPDSVAWLQAQIGPWLTDFDGKNFVDWSRDRGHNISATMHPLESAHRDAADFLWTKWNTILRSNISNDAIQHRA